MKLTLIGLLFVSLSAHAQFEYFDDVLGPSTLTPPVGIICKADIMFSKADLVIDVKKGVATQKAGGNIYTYDIDSFTFEKVKGKDKNVRAILKGELSSVVDEATGKKLNAKTKGSYFSFNSYLPTKDGKKFKANSFELASHVSYEGGSSMSTSSKTTNSTSCTLVKGGKYVKDLNKNTSVTYSGVYAKPEVNDSDRNIVKDIESDKVKSTSQSTSGSEQ